MEKITNEVMTLLFRFAKSFERGSIVNIPMAKAVESINTASALAIILYEIRRQFNNLE